MWGSSTMTSCSSPSSAVDIQSRMEKYLISESGRLGGGGGNGGNGGDHTPTDDVERDVTTRCHGDRSTTRMSSHSEFTSSGDVKTSRFLHPDVLDLHKEGTAGLGPGASPGGAGGGGGLQPGAIACAAAAAAAAAAVSLERDAAVISRWQPLGQSPPRAHNHTGGQLGPSLGIGSPPPLPLSRSIGSLMRNQSDPGSSLLDRFGPVVGDLRDRFDMAVSGLPDVSMEPTSSTMPSAGGTPTTAGNSSSTGGGKAPRTIKSYHCRMCEQEFANKSDMQRHAKEAHRMEDKGHKCTQCLKSFPSSQQLAQHSLVHTNVRKYACNYCDKAFKQLSHVQQHQRIHTGERPYRCPVDGCSKAFRQLSSLQQHLKGHNIPMPKSFAVTRGPVLPPPVLPPASAAGSPLSGSPSSGHGESSSGNKLNSSLARPHDLTCQVCEKHCADEVRFFCHIHKYHPDYWRVFSGGRPLSDFIETPAASASKPATARSPGAGGDGAGSQPAQPREKRYACTVCHKRYSHETGYVKHMAGHPGFAAAAALGAAAAADGLSSGFSRVSLYNCTVCAKLFTKEAYLLRHMEMKLDPAHAAGLEELKKSSSMFRTSTTAAAAAAFAARASYINDRHLHGNELSDEKIMSRPGSIDDPVDNQGMSSPNGRYSDEVARHSVDAAQAARRHAARSTSCVSPMSSASSSSPSTPPPQSFAPYPMSLDNVARRMPQFMSESGAHLPQSSDYHHRSVNSYRSPSYPPLSASRSPTIDEDMQGSSPEMDEGRDIRNPNPRYSGLPSASQTPQHRHSNADYYSPPSPYNRFQPFPSPVTTSISRSGMVSPVVGAGAFAYPQYPPYSSGPPHLQDSYLRRSVDFTDREAVNSFR